MDNRPSTIVGWSPRIKTVTEQWLERSRQGHNVMAAPQELQVTESLSDSAIELDGCEPVDDLECPHCGDVVYEGQSYTFVGGALYHMPCGIEVTQSPSDKIHYDLENFGAKSPSDEEFDAIAAAMIEEAKSPSDEVRCGSCGMCNPADDPVCGCVVP